MPLDTRIALTGQPLQLESPTAQYSQLMSVVNAGTQNQLAQMQMSAAQRAMQEDEDVKNYLANPTNDLTTAAGQRGLLRFGTKGQATLKSLADQRKLQAEEDKSNYEFEVKKVDRALNEIINLTDLPMAFASIDRQVANKSITPQQGAELKTRINNAPDFSTWQNQTIMGMLGAKERLDAMEDQRYQAFLRKSTAAAPAAPPAVVPTAPINATEAPLVRPTQAAVPLDKLNVSEDARGNKTYYLDGVPIPEEKFAELFAASAAPAPLSGTRAAGLAPMTPAPAPMAPAALAAPAPAPASTPAVAAAPAPMAPAAPPDMANALALKIKGLQDQRNQLEPFLRSSSAKLKYEDLGKQIDNLSKGFSISAGGAYTIPGVGTFERPPTASEFEQLLANSGMTDAQKIAARAARVNKETTFAPPMQVIMPVAIQDPKDPTKVIYVDRKDAIGKTPAVEVTKPLTALQTQKLKTEKAADTAHVSASQSTADELEKLTNELVGSEDGKIKPHPGLGGITGFAAYLPNLPKGDARQAQQKLDTFKGKILALGRGMASQDGKLGNMAVQEWKFVSDAVQAIDPKAGNLDEQMRDVVRQAKAFATRQKSKFESTYEDTGAAAPAAGRGVDTNNPLLK